MDSSSRPNPKHLRAGLLMKGLTLAAFAKQHRYSMSTVKAAICGKRNGPKSKAILRRVRITTEAA